MSEALHEKLQATLGDAYRLERELGGGGMSRVFVAEDTALGRRIVVKMLPSDTAAGVSVERFRREIQVLARLQHPHIVPVLSAGQIDELPFYTMPYVKGESLRERLARSAEMSLNEAIHILRDVAAALAYAHGEGVVHRDIKPDNVIVSGGVAVVADFGVAKAVDVSATDAGGPQTGLTSLGIALGTPAYMAPEQASADPHVDHRADIYSFGCLAYELVAGASPFAGRSPQQVLAAHVTELPEPLSKRRPNVLPGLSALTMKCLEKRAGDRPQSADELMAALDAMATTPSGGMAPTSERLAAIGRGRTRWIAGAMLTVVVVALAVPVWRRATALQPIVVGAATPIAVSPALEENPAISPDGKIVAFAAATPSGRRIFIRQTDGERARLLSGDLDGNHAFPAWSPDGTRISFFANGAIYVVPALSGGIPRRLIERAGNGSHSWLPDGSGIAYALPDQSGIALWHASDDQSRSIATGAPAHSPSLSPDGTLLLYCDGNLPTLANVSGNIVWAVPVAGGTRQRISDSTHVNISPIWMPDGRSVLFLSNMEGQRNVYQVAVNGRGEPTGSPVRITTALQAYGISISADGSRLAYDVVRNFANIYSAAITADGADLTHATAVTRDNQHIESLGLSHDGKWLAYDSDRDGNFDIYKVRVTGGDPVQITTNASNDFAPMWSPDDRRIAFHSTRNGTRDIFIVSTGGGAEEQVTSGPDEDYWPSWSADGASILFSRNKGNTFTISTTTLERGGTWSTPRAYLADRTAIGGNNYGRWSPDGRLIAATRNGSLEIAPVHGSPRTLVDSATIGPIAGIAWGPSSDVVYVSAFPTSIYAVPIATGKPKRIAAQQPDFPFGRWEFATDGRRLFVTRAAWESDIWIMELRK